MLGRVRSGSIWCGFWVGNLGQNLKNVEGLSYVDENNGPMKIINLGPWIYFTRDQKDGWWHKDLGKS